MSVSIYKIEPICEHDDGDVYIGSTRNTINHRFREHKKDYNNQNKNNITSCILFEKYGVSNCKIEELESCDENVRYEREAWWVDNTNCVNKRIPSGLNRADYCKKYYQENINTIRSRSKEYYEQHKEHIRETKKQYQNEHIEKIKKSRSRPYECDCGCSVQCYNKSRHFRSKKHKIWEEETKNAL